MPRTGLPVPDSVVTHFALIRPWARACSIAGIVVALGLAGLTLMGATPFFSPMMGGQLPPAVGYLVGTTLLLVGFLLAAAVGLWRFSASVDQLCLTMDGADLEVTVHLLHRFWRLAGVSSFWLILWMIGLVLFLAGF